MKMLGWFLVISAMILFAYNLAPAFLAGTNIVIPLSSFFDKHFVFWGITFGLGIPILFVFGIILIRKGYKRELL